MLLRGKTELSKTKSHHHLITSQVNSLGPLLRLPTQSGFEIVLQWDEEIRTIFLPKS